MRTRATTTARRLALALAAFGAVAATVTPAQADEEVGVNVGIAGTVAGHHVEAEVSAGTAFAIDGQCTFDAQLTPPPSASLIVNFGGAVWASGSGLTEATAPELTDVTCRLTNVPAGGTNTMSSTIRTNGPVSAVADSTALATNGPKLWPVLPLTVCVSGVSYFGPINPRAVTLPEKCKPVDIPLP
jgi:hypothetical protein